MIKLRSLQEPNWQDICETFKIGGIQDAFDSSPVYIKALKAPGVINGNLVYNGLDYSFVKRNIVFEIGWPKTAYPLNTSKVRQSLILWGKYG